MGTWTPPVIVDRGPRGGRVTSRTLANTVSDGYFATIGIPILRGRAFTRQEATIGAPVAVVSAAGARMLWPNADPLGQRLQLDMDFRGTLKAFDVIGVAADVTTEEGCSKAFAETQGNLGPVEILINNFGARAGTSWSDTGPSELAAAFQGNVVVSARMTNAGTTCAFAASRLS